MQKISPCLWFDANCEEAVNFYTDLFPNSKIHSIKRYPHDMQVGPNENMGGKILTAIFELDGLVFQALDGGPTFTKNPSVSFMVSFDPSQEENPRERLDKMWAALTEGGKILMPLDEYPFSKHYGWVEDRFGVSWQLILNEPTGETGPKIIPCMLFVGDVCGKAEEALHYYASLFKKSKMGAVAHYPAGMEPDKEGTAMFAEAELDGSWIVAMDSAHDHKFAFNEGISFCIECANQEEVDHFWNAFTKDGEESMCGWLKDKYGFSWQIVPTRLIELMNDSDEKKANRVLQAMLEMKKIDIQALEKAYKG